jgi:hypothetical protein
MIKYRKVWRRSCAICFRPLQNASSRLMLVLRPLIETVCRTGDFTARFPPQRRAGKMHLDLIRWRKGMIRRPFDPFMGQG